MSKQMIFRLRQHPWTQIQSLPDRDECHSWYRAVSFWLDNMVMEPQNIHSSRS